MNQHSSRIFHSMIKPHPVWLCLSLLIPVLAGCSRTGVVVTERSDSRSPVNLYIQTTPEPVAFEVTSKYQEYGFGRAVESLESKPMSWAVIGGESFRATNQGYSETVDPSLVVTALTIPNDTLPYLRGTIQGQSSGLSMDSVLRDFQRQIRDPLFIVMLGKFSTGEFNNNNQDDYRDAIVQVVIAPETGGLSKEMELFIPDTRRVESDEPRFLGAMIPLTSQAGITLDNPKSMRYAVETVEMLDLDTRIRACEYKAYDISEVILY